MEGAIAARISINASTAAGGHIFSRAGPKFGVNISPHVCVEIFTSLFSSICSKIFTVFPSVDAEIFFRPRAQERQVGRPDYSGRRRASKRSA
jgi:hypothetical protein